MTKKLLALLLSILLLMSLVPAAAAAGEDPGEDPCVIGEAAEAEEGEEPLEIVYIEPEPEVDDGIERTPAGNIVLPDNWEDEEEEERELTPEEEAFLEEEAAIREELAIQARHDYAMATLPEPVADLPMASDATVNVTVKLPSGVTGGGPNSYTVRLYPEAKVDSATGKVTFSGSSRSKGFSFDSTGTATVSLSVDAGSYIVVVNSSEPVAGMCHGYTYFNADGTVADSRYLAKGFTVSSGGTVSKTVTLPKAERTISGKLTFSKAMESQRTLQIYINSGNNPSDISSGWTYITVPKGATSVDFTVGTKRGTCYLEFSLEKWAYYDIYGKLSRDYDDRFYFNLLEKSVSGLVINGDPLLGEIEASESVKVDVTVKLPAATTVDNARYLVFARYADRESSYYDYEQITNVPKGSKTLECSFWVPKDYSMKFEYEDITDLSWSPSYHPDARYAAESGITTQFAGAKAYSFTENSTVTIGEPACYTVTGTVDRGTFCLDLDQSVAVYVFAKFADGENYASHVVFYKGAATASYTIYVPQSQKGKEFSLTAVRTENLNSNRLMESSRTDPVTYTLSGNVSAKTIQVTGAMTTLSGKVSLAEAADRDIALYVSYGQGSTYYVIRKGKTSIEYSFDVEAGQSYTVTAQIDGNYSRYWRNTRVEVPAADGAYDVPELILPLKAKITGTVSLPKTATKNAVTAYVQASIPYSANSTTSSYMQFSIRASEGSGNYELWVPDGASVRYMRCYATADATDEIVTSEFDYVGADWSTGNASQVSVSVSGNKDKVDFLLPQAMVLSGTFVTEDGSAIEYAGEEDSYRTWLYTSGKSYRMTVYKDGTWKAALPQKAAGTFSYLEFSTSRDFYANLVDTYCYYKEGALSTSSDDATAVTVPPEGLRDLKVYVRTGWKLTGRLLAPEGGYVDGVNSDRRDSVSVYAESAVGSFYGYAYIDSRTGPWSYTIIVPKTAADDYKLRYSGSSSIAENYSTNIVFNMRIESETFSVSKDRSVPDITLELAKAVITGTVSRPAGHTEYISGTVYVKTDTNKEYNCSFYISESNSSDTFGIAIPESDEAKTYTVRYYTYSDGLARNGYLMKDGSVSKKAEDAYAFSFADDSTVHSFTFLLLPPYIKGKIYVPDGITESFNVYVYGLNGTYFSVNPSALKSDDKGQYFEYSLASDSEYTYTFNLRYEIDDDPNNILAAGGSYYYLQEDGSFKYGTSSGAKSFSYTPGMEALTQDFTLLKGVYLFGTLAADDGSELQMAFSGNYTNTSFSVSNGDASAKIYSDGRWAACLSMDAVGTQDYLGIRINGNTITGVVEGTYYYSTGAEAVTSTSDATALTVPEAGLKDLKLVVRKGWIISGAVKPAEGGYVSMGSSSRSMSINVSDPSGNTYYGSVTIRSGSGPWTYSVVVPKEAGEYTIRYTGGSISSSYETNIIFNQAVEVKASVSGDTTAPDLELVIARTTVTGAISLPAGSENSAYVRVTVTTYDGDTQIGTYNSDYVYVYASDGPKTYKVSIPSTDTGTKYTVSYYDSNGSYARYGYLTETGVGYSAGDAFQFTFGETNVRNFTLLDSLPILAGKIYIPAGMTEAFEVQFQSPAYKTIEIDPANCLTDANGSYVEYALTSSKSDTWTGYISYYISSDPNDVLYTGGTLYLKEDGSFSTNYSDRKNFSFTAGETVTQDLTLVKAVKIRGSFCDEDGKPIAVSETWAESNSIYVSWRYSSGSGSANVKPKADGSWSANVSPDKLGDITYLSVSVYNSEAFTGANVVNGTYYYAADKVTTDQSEATAFTLTAEGISGINIRMTTGWKLTGLVKLPAGGTLDLNERTLSADISAQNEDNSFYGSASVHINSNEGPWSYSLVVPKKADTYKIRYNGAYVSSDITTNVLLDSPVEVTVSVSGDNAAAPDIVLATVRCTVSGTVTLPDSVTNSCTVYVYLTTANGTEYRPSPSYFSLSSSNRTGTYSIRIPTTDTSATYTMYYQISSSYDKYLEYRGYLTTGGASASQGDQATFTFGSADVHNFKLVEKAPVFQGKIYIPEKMTSPFKISIGGSYLSYETYTVDPATCAKDSSGRKYFPYESRYTGSYTYGSEQSSTLYYQITEDASNTLISKDYYSSKYLDENGNISPNTTYIPWTVGETKTIDFEPLTWDVNYDKNIIQSAHGIISPDGSTVTYTYDYTYPADCTSLTFHFAIADTSVKIYYGADLTSTTTQYSSRTGVDKTVNGNKVRFEVSVSSSYTKYYGFAIDKVTANGVTEPVTGLAAVYTESGTEPAVMLEDVQEGSPVTAVFVGDSETPVKRTALAALYDADGKFLSFSLVEVELSKDGSTVANFRFDNTDEAAVIKIMLLDPDTFQPLIEDFLVVEQQQVINR